MTSESATDSPSSKSATDCASFGSATDSARKSPPCALVIFGASGDLTQRKLIPAIERLARHERLPHEFTLIGVARSQMTDEEFAQRCAESAKRAGGETSDTWTDIIEHIRYVSGGYDDPGTYDRLGDVLDDQWGAEGFEHGSFHEFDLLIAPHREVNGICAGFQRA